MKLQGLLPAVAALWLSACAALSGSGEDALKAEADRLLETDKTFAALVLSAGAPAAYERFLDEHAASLPANGDPVEGRDAIRARLASGANLLSWTPRYAEVFEPGDWGWTWGEWQLYEPGAAGRRLAQGKYLNVWQKQSDDSWKVRVDNK
jgi:ketosteroid isomerase-like protein